MVEGGAPLVGGVAICWWPFNFVVVLIDMCRLKSPVLLVHVQKWKLQPITRSFEGVQSIQSLNDVGDVFHFYISKPDDVMNDDDDS